MSNVNKLTTLSDKEVKSKLMRLSKTINPKIGKLPKEFKLVFQEVLNRSKKK